LIKIKNKLQSNFKVTREGDHIAGQSFNLSRLKQYTEKDVWNFLRTFDLIPRSIRQSLLNYYKVAYDFLITLSSSVHFTTLNLIKDRISLVELTFEYTTWYQTNENLYKRRNRVKSIL